MKNDGIRMAIRQEADSFPNYPMINPNVTGLPFMQMQDSQVNYFSNFNFYQYQQLEDQIERDPSNHEDLRLSKGSIDCRKTNTNNVEMTSFHSNDLFNNLENQNGIFRHSRSGKREDIEMN